MLDHTPGIRACATGIDRYLTTGASDGALRILPSGIPGAEIDSAGWKTNADQEGFGVSIVLVFAVRIRITRPIVTDSLAIIYRTDAREGPNSQIVDATLGPPVYSLSPAELNQLSQGMMTIVGDTSALHAPAGATLRYERVVNLPGGVRSGFTASFPACPVSVQLVPRRDLALHLFPGRFSTAAVARLADSVRGVEPIQADANAVVIWDSTVVSDLGTRVVIGVVTNTGDAPLTDPVAWLAIMHDSAARARALLSPASGVIDTLEFPLGRIAPHGIVGFAGGGIQSTQRVGGRRVGSAMLVSDRPVATSADFQSVKRARRRARAP